jgi:hypothetical protein
MKNSKQLFVVMAMLFSIPSFYAQTEEFIQESESDSVLLASYVQFAEEYLLTDSIRCNYVKTQKDPEAFMCWNPNVPMIIVIYQNDGRDYECALFYDDVLREYRWQFPQEVDEDGASVAIFWDMKSYYRQREKGRQIIEEAFANTGHAFPFGK